MPGYPPGMVAMASNRCFWAAANNREFTPSITTRAGFNHTNFAEWVRDGKFEPRQELVRKLSAILSNPQARQVFLDDGADKAQHYIDRPEISRELHNATLVELCAAVQDKIQDLTLTERDQIRDDDESVVTLDDTIAYLTNFFNNEIQQQ